MTAYITKQLVAGIAAITLVGFSVFSAHAADALRVGYQATLFASPMIVALDQDVFKKHGIEIKARPFKSGPDIRDALITGDIDVGTVGGTAFVVGAAVGQLSAIGTVLYGHQSIAVHAKRGSNVKSPSDLKGQTVASRTGTTADAVFRSKVLPANGLSATDLKIVNINFADQISAIASGGAVAMVCVDPFCLIGEEQGLTTELVNLEKFDLAPNMFATTPAFAAKNGDLIVRFLRAMDETAEIFKNKPEVAQKSIATLFQGGGYAMKDSLMRRLVTRINVDVKYLPELPAYFKEQEDGLRKDGKLRGPAVDWDKVLRKEFLEKATGSR